MSERLYRQFFLAAVEAAEQLSEGGMAPFQFIVTTTSAPPDELGKAPHVVLELAPGADDALLFNRTQPSRNPTRTRQTPRRAGHHDTAVVG